MDSLATNLNFNMNIQPPPNGELWGENRNGSFTGDYTAHVPALIRVQAWWGSSSRTGRT